jgi:hypothetical protein
MIAQIVEMGPTLGGHRRSSDGVVAIHKHVDEIIPMRLRSSILVLALFAVGPAIAQTPEVVDKTEKLLAQKRLKGVWVPDLLMTTKGAEAYPLGGRTLSFLENDRFARFEGKRNVASGTYQLEDGYLRLTAEDRRPWDLESSDLKAKTQYAFKVDGDVLTLCYSVGDKGKADDLAPGDGRLVVVYKRQREEVPAKGERGGR